MALDSTPLLTFTCLHLQHLSFPFLFPRNLRSSTSLAQWSTRSFRSSRRKWSPLGLCWRRLPWSCTALLWAASCPLLPRCTTCSTFEISPRWGEGGTRGSAGLTMVSQWNVTVFSKGEMAAFCWPLSVLYLWELFVCVTSATTQRKHVPNSHTFRRRNNKSTGDLGEGRHPCNKRG